MEDREQLNELLAGVPPICLKQYTIFVQQDNFDDEVYVKTTVQLFNALDHFQRRIAAPEAMDLSQNFPQDCSGLITELDTEDRAIYQSKSEALIQLLAAALEPNIRGFVLLPQNEEPSPLNRRLIDEQLKPQAKIVDDRKMQIIDAGEPFDEAAFQQHNQQLHLTRQLYWQQLLHNIVQADLDDIFDCRDANRDIRLATTDQFLYTLDESRKLFEKKIKPTLASLETEEE